MKERYKHLSFFIVRKGGQEFLAVRYDISSNADGLFGNVHDLIFQLAPGNIRKVPSIPQHVANDVVT
jgi:hypothetical protein